MSKLWKSLVTFLDELGEQSGCHQMPERSFFYKGHQFPVCARCTGVCVGQFAAILLGFFHSVSPLLSAFLLALMGVDWGIQEIGLKQSTNKRRFITGILGGFGLFSLYVYAFKKIFCKSA